MRLLVACPSFPLPVRDGLRLQLAGLLTELRRSHEVVLVAETGPGDDLDRQGELCDRLVAVPPRGGRGRRLHDEWGSARSRRPVLVEQVMTSPFATAVRATVREVGPDVVHLSPGWTAALAPSLGAPVVLAPLDASGPNWDAEVAAGRTSLRRALSRRERSRLQRFEASAYRHCAAVVVVTERDAEVLCAGDPVLTPTVITNGIDVAAWARPADSTRDRDLVVVTGALSYPPNVDAARVSAREVLPLLRRQRPGARLRLVGRDPDQAVRELAGDGVEVTGTVPDLRPHLWSAGAYLCPMRSGTGVKNKLLEALAAGAPCVATPLAVSGLGLRDGVDVLLGDSPASLAEQTARVLGDPPLAEALAAAGVQRAGALSWGRTAQAFSELYARVAALS